MSRSNTPELTSFETDQQFENRVTTKVHGLSQEQIRMLMSEIFSQRELFKNEDGFDPRFAEIISFWRDDSVELSDEEYANHVDETMQVAYDYFAENGLEKPSLLPQDIFGEYIKKFISDHTEKFCEVMDKFFSYLAQVSLRPQEQWKICLESFPPEGEYLKCLDGTEERLEKLIKILTTFEHHRPFLNAHDIIVMQGISQLRNYVDPSNEVHIPTYLEYGLGFTDERIIFAQSQIPTALQLQFNAQYFDKFKNFLLRQIKLEEQDRRDKIQTVINSFGEIFEGFDPDKFRYSKELNAYIKSGLKEYEIDGRDFTDYDFETDYLSFNRQMLDQAARALPALEFLEEFLAEERVESVNAEISLKQESIDFLHQENSANLFTQEAQNHIVNLLTLPASSREILIGFEALWMMADKLASNSPMMTLSIVNQLNQIEPDYLRINIEPIISKISPAHCEKIPLLKSLCSEYKQDPDLNPALSSRQSPTLAMLLFGNAVFEEIESCFLASEEITAQGFLNMMEDDLQSMQAYPKSYRKVCENLICRPDYKRVLRLFADKISQEVEMEGVANSTLPEDFLRNCLEIASYQNNSDACNFVLENFEIDADVFRDSDILNWAAYQNNPDLLSILISRIDLSDQNQRSILWQRGEDNLRLIDEIIKTDNGEAFKVLIRAGIAIEEINQLVPQQNQLKAIHVFASRGYANLVKALHELGEDLMVKTSDNNTALHYAAKSEFDCPQVVKVFHEFGLGVENLYLQNDSGYTPMKYAVLNAHIDFMRASLQLGSHKQYLDAPLNESGDRLIHDIARFHLRDYKSIKVLRELGADLNILNNLGCSAIHVAVDKGRKDFVIALVDAGADLTLPVKKTNMTAEIISFIRRDHEMIATLASCGLDVLRVDECGNNILHRNIDENSEEESKNDLTSRRIIRTLVDAGIDLDPLYKTNDVGFSPIAIASLRRKEAVITDLINAGIDVNKEDQDGLTPISQVLKNLSPQTFAKSSTFQSFIVKSVQILQKHGANINHQNSDGETALHILARYGKLPLIEILLKNFPINRDLENNAGETAAYIAAVNGYTSMMMILCTPENNEYLFRKAIAQDNNLVIRNLVNNGDTSSIKKGALGNEYLNLAVIAGNMQIVDHLLKCGVDINGADKNGKTALQCLGEMKNPENLDHVTSELTKRGMKIDEREGFKAEMLKFSRQISKKLPKTSPQIVAELSSVASGKPANNFVPIILPSIAAVVIQQEKPSGEIANIDARAVDQNNLNSGREKS